MKIFDPLNPKPIEQNDGIFCFDVKIFDKYQKTKNNNVYDLKILLNSKNLSLEEIAKNENITGWSFLCEIKNKIKSQLKAAKHSGIDIANTERNLIIDESLWNEFINERAKALENIGKKIVSSLSFDKLDYLDKLSYVRALNEIEKCGIYVEREMLVNLINHDNPVYSGFARKALESLKGNFLDTKFNPFPGITGRLGILDGFNPMTIPHGLPRKAFTSRFNKGKICVFDFNAMDFRSIIYMTGDKELIDKYKDADDFHAVTAEILLGDKSYRNTIKSFCYATLYGGSIETIAEKTGISLSEAADLSEMFWNTFPSIKRTKSKFEEMCKQSRSIKLPVGQLIKLDKPEKAFAIAAQTMSSIIFREALINVVNLCKVYFTRVIFTVHDELVFDFHPDEIELLIPKIKSLLTENKYMYTYKTKYKIGDNYEQATS